MEQSSLSVLANWLSIEVNYLASLGQPEILATLQ